VTFRFRYYGVRVTMWYNLRFVVYGRCYSVQMRALRFCDVNAVIRGAVLDSFLPVCYSSEDSVPFSIIISIRRYSPPLFDAGGAFGLHLVSAGTSIWRFHDLLNLTIFLTGVWRGGSIHYYVRTGRG